MLDLGQQDPVGHHLDQRCVADAVGEANRVPDRGAELDTELLGDPLGDRAGGDAARLRVTDQAGDPAAQLEAQLRQLGALPRARLAGDDDDLMVADGGQQVVPASRDRQLLGVGDAVIARQRLRGVSAELEARLARDGGLIGGIHGGDGCSIQHGSCVNMRRVEF